MVEIHRVPSLLVLALAAMTLPACDSEVAQVLTVTFEPSFGQPPAAVVLVEGESCAGTPIRATVSSEGKFSFQLSSIRGGVGVVTQELSLCAPGAMEPIWQSRHGGGALAIALICRRPASEDGLCEPTFTYR